MTPLDLPEVDVEEVMSKSRFHWHEGSRPDSRETNLELDKIREDNTQLMEDALELEERKAREIKQMNRKIKRSCWAIMLCPVILVAYRWLLYWWGMVCLVLALTTTVARARRKEESRSCPHKS